MVEEVEVLHAHGGRSCAGCNACGGDCMMRAMASFLGRHRIVTITQSLKQLNVTLNHTLENVAFAKSRAVRCATPVSTVWKSPSTEIENPFKMKSVRRALNSRRVPFVSS